MNASNEQNPPQDGVGSVDVDDHQDPCNEDDIRFCDIWTGELAQTCKDAFPDFLSSMHDAFKHRPAKYARLMAAFRTGDLDVILPVVSLLFVGHIDLAREFNHCIPPGYYIEATRTYVAVFLPKQGGWKQFPDGRRINHADIFR